MPKESATIQPAEVALFTTLRGKENKLVTLIGNEYTGSRTSRQENEGKQSYILLEGSINIFCFLKHRSHIYKLTINKAVNMSPMRMDDGVNEVGLPRYLY